VCLLESLIVELSHPFYEHRTECYFSYFFILVPSLLLRTLISVHGVTWMMHVARNHTGVPVVQRLKTAALLTLYSFLARELKTLKMLLQMSTLELKSDISLRLVVSTRYIHRHIAFYIFHIYYAISSPSSTVTGLLEPVSSLEMLR
jgi:hypothetical protein